MRPSGTVGGDESVLRSQLPAAPAAPSPDGAGGAGGPGAAPGAGRPPAVEPGSGLPRSADDSDVGWGGVATADTAAEDERLARERPPHW